MLFVWLSIIVSIIGLGFAGYLFFELSRLKVKDEEIKAVSSYISQGAMTFMLKEYTVLAGLVAVIFLVLLVVPALSWKLAVTFLIGAIFSALAGFIGMKVATQANAQTVVQCEKSKIRGLRVAFASGSITGLTVVSLGLLGIAVFYLIFRDVQVLYGFGFGASLVALVTRVGGGIYTKSADIGADLVGKIEKEIPEDDVRNPAVIADNVGDNVGDVAGMGADLFESYVDSIIVTLILGVVMLPLFGSKILFLPLILAGIGILASIASSLVVRFVKAKSYMLLNYAVWSSAIIVLILSFLAVRLTINNINVFWAVLTGLVAGVLIGLSTEYYTSGKMGPVRSLAKVAETGPATSIISGLSLGFMSTIIPALVIVVAVYLANYFAGLYGVAIAAVGLLSTLGTTLAADAYGPVVDNAAGIARMAGLGSEVRERTEALDAIGNTTAAVGKGFAIGSAALTAIVLLVTFGKVVGLTSVNLISIPVINGLMIGATLPFVFSALTMKAVSKAAVKMVKEVRRQFRDIPGLIGGQTKPDYNNCIKIATSSALKQMMVPGLLAVLAPVVVGLWLGAASLAGMLVGAIMVGFLLAIFMANAGGAWDNAKKFIEGHDSELDTRNAAVIGDMVGDPFKDTAGPALNILIKLMAIVALVIAPLLI